MKHRIHIRIRDLRKERAMTQEGLAELLGISRQTVIALESGRGLPSLPLALQLAEIFERPMEQIFLWDEALAQEMMRAHEMVDADQLLLAAEASLPVAVDVFRSGSELIVKALVPGFSRQEISVEVEPNRLVISGRCPDPIEGDEYLARELSLPCRFSRILSLPVAIEPEAATAEVKRGILTITAPLATRGSHQIQVK